ncbi:TPA: hypothetical protein IAC10_05720 [Candidatus Scatousia excrementigallinarum]|uniref:Uncharacterized protein n=1 Tax=Candidatus Scatousia excrementigallinarum TaxID=2840935 RepID=A0A9D1EZ80_9BACT|nr:hypothetical protein [Candidatus Scatousia excrementigallinarum]
MNLTVNNYYIRHRQQNFNGLLDGAVTSGLKLLDTNEMANAVLIDVGAMVVPRTYYDTKARNKDAGAETFFRELSGTFINCLSAGLLGIGIAKIANNRVMPEVKIDANTWFSKDSVNVLKTAWDNADNRIDKYVQNVFDNLGGRDYKNMQHFKDIEWDKVQWHNNNNWKHIFWNNAGFVDIDEKLKTKNGIITTMTQLIEDKTITKRDKDNALKIMHARIANALGAERDIQVKIGNHTLGATLENVLRDTYDMGRKVFANKEINIDTALKKIAKVNNIKIFGALAGASALGLTNQYINRKITEKRTGKKGFVGDVDYAQKTAASKITKPEEDKNLWLKKIAASAGMIAMVIGVMKVKNLKDFVKKLEFTGPVTSGNAIKIVYASTIVGRFLAADNTTELRESVTRDYFGFLNWLVFGGFAAKGVANLLDKDRKNLFNIKKEGKGLKHWLNDLNLKTHAEIAAKGKDFAKKNIWKLNAAHIAGLAYSAITLGVLLPMINDKMTKYKARKEAAKV